MLAYIEKGGKQYGEFLSNDVSPRLLGAFQ